MNRPNKAPLPAPPKPLSISPPKGEGFRTDMC